MPFRATLTLTKLGRGAAMEHGPDAFVIKDLLVFLFAGGVLVPLLRIGRVPAIVGFVLAGMVLGPYGLGTLASTWPWLGVVTISDPAAAAPFAELGVLFLLFLLGLEFSFERLWALRRFVFGAGLVQVAVSAAAITAIAVLMGVATQLAVAIGLALALSSTAMVMTSLIEQKRVTSLVGKTALGVLLLQDVMVAPILIYVGFLGDAGQADMGRAVLLALVNGALALGAIVIVGRFGLRRVFRLAAHRGGREYLMAVSLLTVVGAAALTAWAGLSLALGAFLAGLLLGETEFKHQTEVDLEPFKGLLLGVFFMTVGMRLNLPLIAQDGVSLLTWLVGFLAIKAGIAVLVCRVFTGSWPVSLEAGLLLASAGEFAFVVFGASHGLIDPALEQRLIALVGLSLVALPALSMVGKGLALRTTKKPAGDEFEPGVQHAAGHVLIIGFGRVGRTIAEILDEQETPYLAIDRNPMRIRKARDAGAPVFMGDATRTEILHAAGIAAAELVVVSVDDADVAEALVRAVRAVRPDLPVIARAHDPEHADRLYAAGAKFVIPDAIEAALQLGGRALRHFGYEGETVRALLAARRDAAYSGDR